MDTIQNGAKATVIKLFEVENSAVLFGFGSNASKRF